MGTTSLFVKKVKEIKRVSKTKNGITITNRKIAGLLEISDSSFSDCMHGRKGYSGYKHIEKLDIIIGVLKEDYQSAMQPAMQPETNVQSIPPHQDFKRGSILPIDSQPLPYLCPSCKEPQDGPPCKNRNCKKSPYYVTDVTYTAIVEPSVLPIAHKIGKPFDCPRCGFKQEASVGRKKCYKCGLPYEVER